MTFKALQRNSPAGKRARYLAHCGFAHAVFVGAAAMTAICCTSAVVIGGVLVSGAVHVQPTGIIWSLVVMLAVLGAIAAQVCIAARREIRLIPRVPSVRVQVDVMDPVDVLLRGSKRPDEAVRPV